MADCMQLLSENHLNGYQIFGLFGLVKTESEPNFGFPHIPSFDTLPACDEHHQAVVSRP